MKKKELSRKVDDEWESFVSRNKIVKKKLDTNKNVFQDTKNISYGERFFFKPKDIESVKTVDNQIPIKANPEESEDVLFKVVEKNKLKKIKNGKLNPEKTLDLHGFTLFKAKEELRRTIDICIRENKRFLLVITGKGRNSGLVNGTEKKIIKTEFPYWLTNKHYIDIVQYFSYATQKHGGTGAYYIFLKKS